jgi:hypothetical protein
MKTKISVFLILVLVTCLPLKVLAAEAESVHGFAAGSLIFPMDDFYQPIADGGSLEVYGLIFYLLDYKDQDCVAECGTTDNCVETCGLTAYWVIDETKTEIGGIDLQIASDDDALTAHGASAVVRQNDPTDGSSGASTAITAWATNGSATDDSKNQVTYRGSVFILDYTDLAESKNMADLAAAYDIINDSRWSAVNVQVAEVPFSAPLHRKMKGIPPKIALMNDDENRDSGNAAILESYLRLAGICDTSYDVLTPYDIAGIESATGTRIPSKLFSAKYDFLWAPHWTAKDYVDEDLDNNSTLDVDDIVAQIQSFVKSGKSLLAECASIEVFEHYPDGHFLTDKGLGHNEGSNDPDWVIYNSVTKPYAQIGDDPIGFGPEGGHLHNWRPYQNGDDYNFDVAPDVGTGDSTYNATVTRFTVDDTDEDGSVTEADWDYYVGGYAYGNDDFGYVVYLGGHKYSKCSGTSPTEVNPNSHLIKLEFDSNVTNEIFTLTVYYTQAGIAQTPVTANFVAADIGTKTVSGALEIDFSGAKIKGKKIDKVAFKNTTDTDLSITKIVLDWIASGASNSQKFKKLTDTETDIKHWKAQQKGPVEMPITKDFTILASPSVFDGGCTINDDCEYTNQAGVRYVLNTLFNIKYTVKSNEYVRAPPIVSHPYLYQGSFEYPGYQGHFRRYDVEQEVEAGALPASDWDTGAHRSYGRIKDANTGNGDGSRRVFTAQLEDGNWQRFPFDTRDASLDKMRTPLNVTPNDGDDDDEIRVINRLRGREWNPETGAYEELDYKLGGIMHSAPVIVRAGNSRVGGSRPEIAYVGDIYGMLHAIRTEYGKERWAYIPSNLLGKLQNDRSDPYATQDFAAVDASPTARDVYWDSDDDGVKEWRTILVSPQGFGGTSIFALDVTYPRYDKWKLLWETTVLPNDTTPATPGGGMGYAYRVAMDKVKWPVLEDGDANGNGIPNEIIGYEAKWMVFVATSYAQKVDGFGGLHIFGFDLKTGERVWGFSSQYGTSNNDVPGAVTTIDLDNDTFADRVYVGDINGRMWELEAHDGSSPYGTYVDDSDPDDIKYFQIPLFDAGVGYPITVSPAAIMHNGHAILVFGTGGADWAEITNTYNIYGVDATRAKTDWDALSESEKSDYYQTNGGATTAAWTIPLGAGEKVWSTPTIAEGQIWIVTSTGSMESDNPGTDSIGGSSTLRRLDLDGIAVGTPYSFNKKVRGSLYVSNKHLYMTTFDNEIIQLGDGVFTAGTGNSVVLKSWQHQ